MRSLDRLRRLTGSEKRLLAVALAVTPLVAAGVAVFGLRRVHAAMARWPQSQSGRFPIERAALARARSVAGVVAIAAGRGAVRARCLARSLVLWWLLKHDGIETTLRVGVNRDGGRLRAHAWVEYLGRPLNDARDIALHFLPFERDFGASAEHAS